jgi:poly-gamma-glutamate capsule biosynthesis protein CapA/YwtB (metallophosphatase superfamily)
LQRANSQSRFRHDRRQERRKFAARLVSSRIQNKHEEDAVMPYDAAKGSISMALAGDILLSRGLKVFREPEFLSLRELLHAADVCFANLESSVLRYGEAMPAVRTGTHMVTEPELLEDLKWLGIDMVSCANSHSLNFGEEGLMLQNRYLDAAGIAHAGTGENLRQASSPTYVETPNGRLAMIAATAHLPSDSNRAAHQRVDFRGKPGVNALGSRVTFSLDAEAFAALKRIARSLGFDRERSRTVQRGFHSAAEIGVEEENEFDFRGDRYRRADRFDIATRCNGRDLEENLRQIREARRQADFVLVSLHSQDSIGRSWLSAERLTEIECQPDFVTEFAHAAIDAGADVIAVHGPHMFMGVELYQGKPIFYSLGNFCMQNETLRHVPAHHFERFGLDAYATPADFFDARTAGDKGHPATREFWESALALCRFENRRLTAVELYPIEMGFGQPRSQRGRPLLAEIERGSAILERIRRLSSAYGTPMELREGKAVIVPGS